MKKTFKLFLLLTLISFTAVSAAEEIARVTKTRGLVQIKRLTEPTFQDVSVGGSIFSGDAIKVGNPGFCMVIYLDDKSVLKIRESTQFQFIDTENTRTLDIEFGKILSDVKKDKKKDFRVETPVSVGSVKGTQFWTVSNKSGFDKFYGLEGQLEVFNSVSGQSVMLGPGQMTLSTATGQIMTSPASPEEIPDDPEAEDEVEEPEEEEVEEEEPEEDPQEPEEPEEPEEPQELEEPEEPEEPEELEEMPEEEPIPEPEPEADGPFNFGLGLGSVTIDGVLYNQLALRPEMKFGKLGIGLDLVVYIDSEGNIRKEEWDDVTDIVDKFLYIRWAEKKDPYWFKLGALDGVTLGYGGLLNRYSNMMEFPSIRKVGFNAGVNIARIGAELFAANVKELANENPGTLIGLRGSYRISKALPLRIGANFVMDMNQFGGLSDADEDSYPDIFDDFPDNANLWNDTDGDGIPDFEGGSKEPESGWDIDGDGDNILDSDEDSENVSLKPTPFSILDNEATATGFAFDLGYPILNTKVVALEVYTEFNQLVFPAVSSINRVEKTGSGITIPGLRANLFKFLNLSFEYRIKEGYFIPQFFDQAYDLNRVIVSYDVDGNASVNTKDMYIFSDPSSKASTAGYYGSAGADIFGLVQFTASYTSMKASDTEFNSFFALLSANTDNIPKLSAASAYYQRNNDENPFDFKNPSENTILGYRIGYEVSKGVSLVWNFRQFYRDDGSGNNVLEPIKQTTIETVFNF